MKVHTFYSQGLRFALDPRQAPWVLSLLMLTDALLTSIIVWKVSYTEIDFTTYMMQTQAFLLGSRDYTFIEGPSGPCVYPAAHLYFYSLIYRISSEGVDIVTAQWVFGGLYLLSVLMAGWIYIKCTAPPFLFPLLIFSKRLHSIFVLRLFNDGIADLLLLAAILSYQHKRWKLGSLVLSLGIGVKMTVLLALPGVLTLMAQAMSATELVTQVTIILAVQVNIALPFLWSNSQAYLSRAFEFSRQFLFEWTVNWRFVGEEVFLSKTFSAMLLIGHVTLLVAFALARWMKPAEASLIELMRWSLFGFPEGQKNLINSRVTPRFIASTVWTSVTIGMLCARSLHYQFYSYIAWATPLLLWEANVPPALIYILWAAQEWSWNVFPSTNVSSMVVVGSLAMQLISVWLGTGVSKNSDRAEEHAHED